VDELTEDLEPTTIRTWRDPLVLVVVVILLGLVAGLGFWFGTRTTAMPTENSPEAGFARDMATHHAQAVDMAALLRDRTDNPEMRQVALDMMLTQQAQIGQMQGWLAVWNLPLAQTGPAMAWMGMPMTGPMPGMASPDDLNRLRSLKGLEAEGLFLSLMIPHHRGGVDMAKAILERTKRPEVVALAESIIYAQNSEIDLMQQMLKDRGLPPVPEATEMHHNMTNP
jgi:uncharacterized protein (DUF305 family)